MSHSLLRPGAVSWEEKWSGIRDTISQVVQLKPVKMATWNDHYSDIYALCEAFPTPYAKRLYQETQHLLVDIVSGLHQMLSAQRGRGLLTTYHTHWRNYQQGAHYLDNLFNYFNRVSLKELHPEHGCHDDLAGLLIKKEPPKEDAPVEIRQMALLVWRSELLSKLEEGLVKELLAEISRSRSAEPADLTIVRDTLGSLVEVESDSSLCYYRRVFEKQFLTATGQHYRQEAVKLSSELRPAEYAHTVVARLREARGRGEKFLHPSSIIKFFRECEARLVEDLRVSYLNPAVPYLVKNELRNDLSNLFILLRPLPYALDPLVSEFEDHVTHQGVGALRKLTIDQSDSVVDFITTVLEIHQKFFKMVSEIFNSHQKFINALDKACRGFVNQSDGNRQPKAPILLARYCDQLLRKSSKGTNEQEIDEKLDKAIIVFRYLEDKDMFQRFYTRTLSRRLVQHLSSSMEAEENMIQKLKHACGYEYTARLQRMLLDIRLSSEGNTRFTEHAQITGKPLTISFSALVLQAAAWPLASNQATPSLPENMVQVLKEFETYYMSKHCGRRLSWLHSLSTGELKMSYLKRPYTACVTTNQIAVLLLYNDSLLHTYESLSHATRLPSNELTPTLQSLVDAKIILLDSGQEIENHSVLKLNKNFSNKRTKFKITASLQKDTQQEVEQTQCNVQEDRKLHIQAAIVRVMKSRKKLNHNQLIEEAIHQLRSRFIPSIPLIKRSIETLIEKQYLERDEGQKDTYKYVA